MSMNETPRSNRVHIALFGLRNAGKSSMVNAITNQEAALVSAVKGTTTDPVYKAMELLPVGPVVLIDTAGLDDEGELGELRKKKTAEVLNKTDVALIVIDAAQGVTPFDVEIAEMVRAKGIPAVGILNKIDVLPAVLSAGEAAAAAKEKLGIPVVPVSASAKTGIAELKKAIIQAVPDDEEKFRIVGDLIDPSDVVVLVVPIDKAAPKGRLILPQQQTIRDILESDAVSVVTKETALENTLQSLSSKPRMVITDSQAFRQVAADTPPDIALTSFSILFARQKGDLAEMVRGARAIDRLKDGDKVLIAEACTHHQQPDDIGRVKMPRWIRQATGKELEFEFANGMKFPENVSDYALIIHCGGCMINRRQMMWRMEQAKQAGVPLVNYGVAIAYVEGILERTLSPFPDALQAWRESK